MGDEYSNKERERIRKIFAKHRKKGKSIADAADKAGIATTTYYSWNENDDWKKGNGWSKGDGWSK